jgi:hypothetical protein
MPGNATLATPAYRWNARAARWQRADGQFVPALAPRQALEGTIAATQTEMLALSRRLQAHTISLAQWQGGMALLSKRLQVTAALAAGGTGTFTPQQSGRLGAILRQQYAALDQMALDIYAGKQPLDGRLLNRTRLYAQAGRATWERIRAGAEGAAGRQTETWQRHTKDSCPGCITQADRGPQPLGTLPPIGSQSCGMNCRCSKRFT